MRLYRRRTAGNRLAAVTENLCRLPELEQNQHADKTHDRSGDIRQIGAKISADRKLARDVSEGANDREWPSPPHALFARNEIKQDPGRQQGEYGDNFANRARQRQKGITRNGGESDDRCTERTVG